MAKQTGPIKIDGTIGDLTFYKSGGKHFVKGKSGVEKSRILNDPNFARTRENMSEFGYSASAGKAVRENLNALIKDSKDSRLTSRLTGYLRKLLDSNTTAVRGQRRLNETLILPLNGFNFNKQKNFDSVVLASLSSSEGSSTYDVTVPAIDPVNEINSPAGATHARINAQAVLLQFDGDDVNTKTSSIARGQWFPLNAVFGGETLTSSYITAGVPGDNIIGAVGIEFGQEVNGQIYGLNNKAYNASKVFGIQQIF